MNIIKKLNNITVVKLKKYIKEYNKPITVYYKNDHILNILDIDHNVPQCIEHNYTEYYISLSYTTSVCYRCGIIKRTYKNRKEYNRYE